MLLGIAQFIIIAHIILSWLINFQVLNLRQPLVAQIWDGINRLLEPVYGRLRSVLPNLGASTWRRWWPCWRSMPCAS